MSDVAKAAGVSRATVSYALRGDPRIAAATAEKIRQAAQKLHYNANISARSLRSGRSGIIGVAIYELDRPYPSEMSAAMSREIARRGYQPIVQQTSGSKDDEIMILQKVTSQLCDGMIFSPGQVSDEELRALSHGKPMVLLDDISPDPVFDSVNTACEDGSAAAVRHLIDIGCKHVVVVGPSYDMLLDDKMASSVVGRRMTGCLRAFEEAGVDVDASNFLPLEHWDPIPAREAAYRLLDSDDYRDADGVFCMTDTIAISFMRGLADRGVRVPDDIALVGFDGVTESEYAVPSLTTVRTDLDDLARRTLDLLIDRINANVGGAGIDATGGTGDNAGDGLAFPDAPQRLTAAWELVKRESTRR
ncbi:LacI family transcriptional regulator [Bifidobacterium amazonense]|uniref:LacI family transcriptional regulator n=1 Tax=Bifidobacterium amazonense TaxID=2809027 RepID=A0ABS9VTP0_9BIFI|nr:LacI family DNA-binding transcriptional regulator [Bifidobacterium amazonense]MCH9275461.1 LacI family transcriptional regulator [Bifidobacterium amazonense]